MSQPVEVVTNIVRDTRSDQYQKELAKKFALIRKQNKQHADAIRIAEQRNRQTQFLATHSGTPKLFNHAEVAELNLYVFIIAIFF